MDWDIHDEKIKVYCENPSKELRDLIIEAYLPLVVSIVNHYNNNYMKLSREDLIQIGSIGLLKSIDNFDLKRNLKFSTYATHSVIGEIRHFIRDKTDIIRKPRWFLDLRTKIDKFVDDFVQKEKRMPDSKEISKGLNVSEDTILEVMKIEMEGLCIFFEEEGQAIYDLDKIRSLRYQSFHMPIEDVAVLQDSIDNLKEIEKKVVYFIFYMDLSQTQVGQILGLSQRKVSRVLSSALSSLREILTKDVF